MMNKNLLTNLPEHVLINNILLSKVLPNKSLLSLRCVCKYLRNLITSSDFINMQMSKEHNNTNQLVLIKSTHHRPADVFFSLYFNGGGDASRPEEVEIVSPIEYPDIWGSCNGLVCLSKGNDVNTVCLWNPFTKEYKVLPPPLPLMLEIPIGNIGTTLSLDIEVGSISYGFGYDRLLDDYKVIRCSEHLLGRYRDYEPRIPITEFQVYTLGTNTWRKIDNNPYRSYFVFWLLMKNKSIVFVNGALHWIMSTSNWFMVNISERTEQAKIVSLDIEKEVFGEIQTPSMAKFKPDFCSCPLVQVLRGNLCVLELDSSTETFYNVWMMMDYGVKESWTKLFTILRTEVSYNMTSAAYRLLRFCENGTEILMGSYNEILVYDTINNKAREVEFREDFGECMYQSEIYIESLVSLNSGVYKGAERRIGSKRRRRRSKKKRVIEQAQLVKDFGSIN